MDITQFTTENIITGEKFLLLCDWIIMTPKKIQFHKTLNNFTTSEKIIIFDNEFKNISDENMKKLNSKNNSIIFICNYYAKIFCDKILPKININFKLIFHNEDALIDESFKEYFENNKIRHIYAQNIGFYHSKLTSLPIGIANSQWRHGQTDIVLNCIKNNFYKDKSNLVYFNFNIGTNRKIRPRIYQLLQNKGYKPVMNQVYSNYVNQLANHKFAFNPPGNGVDCHRMWECLYFGVIPILERSPHAEYYQSLPILIIDKWEDINNKLLEKEYLVIKNNLKENKYNFELLDYNFYKNKILL